jgi:phage-related protein
MSSLWGVVKDRVGEGAAFIVDKIRGIPDRLRGLVGGFRSAGAALIGAIADGIKNAGGFASDFAGQIWSAVKSAINSGIAQLNNALEFSIKVGPKSIGVNPPDIGYLARGTNNWRGGLAVVGEEGPELVNLPRGSQVMSHRQSMGAMRGMGSEQPIIVQFVLDGKVIEQSMIKRSRETGRPLQVRTI